MSHNYRDCAWLRLPVFRGFALPFFALDVAEHVVPLKDNLAGFQRFLALQTGCGVRIWLDDTLQFFDGFILLPAWLREMPILYAIVHEPITNAVHIGEQLLISCYSFFLCDSVRGNEMDRILLTREGKRRAYQRRCGNNNR